MRPAALLLPIFLLATLPVDSQQLSITPIEGFQVPSFNEDGYREWDLRGDNANYQADAGTVDIETVVLKVYSGDASNRLDYTVNSARASYDRESQLINGDGGIEIMGEGFEVTGERWTYASKTGRFEVREQVHVVFEHELGDLLK